MKTKQNKIKPGIIKERIKIFDCIGPTLMAQNKPSTSMTQEACKSKLLSVLRSFMHPCPGNRVAIGRAFIYHAIQRVGSQSLL